MYIWSGWTPDVHIGCETREISHDVCIYGVDGLDVVIGCETCEMYVSIHSIYGVDGLDVVISGVRPMRDLVHDPYIHGVDHTRCTSRRPRCMYTWSALDVARLTPNNYI